MSQKKSKITLLTLFALIFSLVLGTFSPMIASAKTSTKWYNNYSVIAHAMGSVNGVAYTNSKEAFNASYKKGYRVFEADFSLTSDKKVVLWHDWVEDAGKYVKEKGKKVPSYKFFMSHKICKKYTPISLSGFVSIMKKYPNIYVVTDSKETEYMQVLKQLVKESKKNKSILDRVIVQVYDYDQLSKIKKIYNFKNYLFTTYKLGDRRATRIGSFCKKNSIPVVGVPPKYAGDKKYVKTLKSYGLKVYTYTINKTENARYYRGCGIDGIYTDVITKFETTRPWQASDL